MPQLCLYFQLHQPYRLENFNVFNLGKKRSYFNRETEDFNKTVFRKVAQKSYLPMLTLLKKTLKKHPQFCFALSCSGVFLEQALAYQPKIVSLLQDLIKTGRVELLAETYYHSLSFLYSSREFVYQIKKHIDLIESLLNFHPRVFRNTELIYSNDLLKDLLGFHFKGVLTEAVDIYLQDRKKTQIFSSVAVNNQKLALLLKHAQLSDDVAFRFSDKSWNFHPLSVDKYLEWIEIYPEDEIINLFMDFETFGEHQWADTGIFEFFAQFVKEFLNKPWNSFKLPFTLFDEKSKLLGVKNWQYQLPEYNVKNLISWADVHRDISAWRENDLQYDALRVLYALQEKILNTGDKQLIDDWRKLQTSDHFYYMCTKWAADGDVHAYFSPYESPYEAYRRYSIVLADLKERLL